MMGKIFITRSGYDPELGKHVKDPYLGSNPTLGACRPDVRKCLRPGDHIFVVSGKVSGSEQFVMGGFEIASKIDATEAYQLFPDLRLRKRADGQLTGNIIVDADGKQHELDDHSSFERRVQNYVVGKNLVALATADQISKGRQQTLEALRSILQRNGNSPFALIGRGAMNLTEIQVLQLREWLEVIRGTAQSI